MYLNILPASLNFMIKNKSFRLLINDDSIVLYQIFENDDDKIIFQYQF